MSVLQLVLAEIRYRQLNFILSLLAVATAAALFIGGPTLISGFAADTRQKLDERRTEADKQILKLKSETEKKLAEMDKATKRIMRDIGVNLRIVHKDTHMGDLYTDFKAVSFDESDVEKLANAKKIEKIVHVIAILQEKIKWNGRSVFVVGILPKLTQSQKNAEKAHMVKKVVQGTVLVGHELRGDYKEGDTIEIKNIQLKIAKIMPEMGDIQDAQFVMHLHDVQQMLNMQGKINQIMALNCKCLGDRISAIREELEGILPNTKVTEITNRATAREKQRNLVAGKSKEQLLVLQSNADQRLADLKMRRENQEGTLQSLTAIVVPLGVLASAAMIGLLTWLNVRERRPEIGLFRALGKGSVSIMTLFLGKSALLGFLGGSIGCGLGYGLVLWGGSQSLGIPVSYFAPNLALILATVIGAPIVAILASYLPTLSAVMQDPAIVLMDQ